MPFLTRFRALALAGAAVMACAGLGSLSGCASAKPSKSNAPVAKARKPNVVFVLVDDLGFGQLGVYGQKLIATPNLDRMAAEGLKFSDFYAGAPVCAPSRAVLITGRHTGHVSVRGNANKEIQKIRPHESTLAEVLKGAGYKTALVGKWGLGEEGSGATPNERGFDFFYGYLNQVHAHNYYPEFLWRNGQKEKLRNEVQLAKQAYGDFHGGYATKKVDWTHELFMNEAERFVRDNKDSPFFLYLSLTVPHGNNEARDDLGDGQEVPDYGPYADKPWPNPQKGHAASITRLDEDMGKLLALLRSLEIGENTLVIFTSDNGPHNEGGFDPSVFTPSGPLRGMKRDLYEGGVREPTLAWWPGQIAPGRTSRHVAYFGDVMATLAELAGVPTPAGTDSRSFLPELLGRQQVPSSHIYFEFYEQGGKQAVRKGKWKAVRAGLGQGPIELYDLEKDLGEAHDLAAQHPEIVQELAAIMAQEHTPDPNWKAGGRAPAPPPPGHGVAPF